MGKTQLGILGDISGRVGPVVGANWNGINIVRARPKRSRKDPTQQQTEYNGRDRQKQKSPGILPGLAIHETTLPIEPSLENILCC